jgi:hypothetical protein
MPETDLAATTTPSEGDTAIGVQGILYLDAGIPQSVVHVTRLDPGVWPGGGPV